MFVDSDSDSSSQADDAKEKDPTSSLDRCAGKVTMMYKVNLDGEELQSSWISVDSKSSMLIIDEY